MKKLLRKYVNLNFDSEKKVMDLNLTSQKQENFVNDRQNTGERLSVLSPNQVMVGSKVKMSHKERQIWLKNRVYYQNKQALRDAMNTNKLI